MRVITTDVEEECRETIRTHGRIRRHLRILTILGSIGLGLLAIDAILSIIELVGKL